MFRAQPDCLAALVLAGNELMLSHKHGEALDKYLRAFRQDPDQPLTALCIATTLAYMAVHPLTAHKQDVCGKALAFFTHYGRVRMLTGENSNAYQASLEQEVYYNIGCFFLDIRLNHFAVSFFQKAVEVFCADEASLPLTREAAFNLSLIYRQSGNDSMACAVMKKYLSF